MGRFSTCRLIPIHSHLPPDASHCAPHTRHALRPPPSRLLLPALFSPSAAHQPNYTKQSLPPFVSQRQRHQQQQTRLRLKTTILQPLTSKRSNVPHKRTEEKRQPASQRTGLWLAPSPRANVCLASGFEADACRHWRGCFAAAAVAAAAMTLRVGG
ncbi:uncharacterized protein BKA78DRAFT_92987 [Phyllosticta capitalensis]|uniref:uncharacterized protein n=1 Tax=Phyllosticta capitalensis TaxID=121624 RepID=UPI00312D870D